MKIIKKIKEGESLTSCFIGYRKISFRDGLRINEKEKKLIRISINLKWALIKLDIIYGII